MRIQKLLNLIDQFCKKATQSFSLIKMAQSYTMPDDLEEDEGVDSSSGSLLDVADQFDIKNEELFNQFETLMSSYKELLDNSQISPESLNPNSLAELASLEKVFETRYDRIINNKYLNSGEDFEEDFDPGNFTKFLTLVAGDVEKRLNDIGKEDISEMQAAQIAQEFNDKGVDRGDQNITWTGNKIQQAIEARKRWWQNLMFRKKVNINDPVYQNYIAKRKEYFKAMLADPERKKIYYEKMKVFQKKFDERNQKIGNLVEKIENAIDPAQKAMFVRELVKMQKEIFENGNKDFHDPEIREQLKPENIIAKYKSRMKKKEDREKFLAEKIKQKFHYHGNRRGLAIDVEGLLIQFNQSVASIKMGIKKEVTKSLKEEKGNPKFQPYKDAIIAALNSGDKSALAIAEKQLNKALNNEAELHPKIINYVKYRENFYAYMAQLKAFRDDQPSLPPEELINVGKELIAAERSRKMNKGHQSNLELALIDIIKKLQIFQG